jgi:Cof subfamily protein (haloacid dehalogenase superfamily)
MGNAAIKMLAVDLDNTLLRSDRTISDYSAGILKRCRECDIKVVFATARPLRTIKPYLQQTPCDAVIYHNGAHIIAEGRRIGAPYMIPIDAARRILTLLRQKHPYARLSVEINDALYANFDVSSVWNYTDFAMTDFSDLPGIGADKILIEACSEIRHEDILSLLTPEVYCQISEGIIYLIMHRDAVKFKAVKTLSGHWGIPLEHIAAFGDDYNDIDMMKYCGLGVAVSNAIPEAVEAADAVAGTNDNDGVARHIEANLLPGVSII